MPLVFVWPLVAGVSGFGLGFFASDSMRWFKWLLVAAVIFYMLSKAGVIK